ncbi:NINE protein [Winogradskyella sp. MIT101101]|uniref:NINE protein n=1 Tax=Winogradskyella sp. MIT101101 TaxID=3098297 RepID=UPI00399AE6B4
MSDDNKDLGDDLNDMLDDAKDGAKKTGDKISQKAKEFSNEAKESAQEFSDGAKEVFEKSTGENKKVLAGVLAIIFGCLGIHKFILGYNKEGGIMLGITLVGIILSCVGVGIFVVWIMSIIGLIEGIIYLTKSDAEFYNTYQVGKKPWF